MLVSCYERLLMNRCIYVYICMYVCICMYVYIYIKNKKQTNQVYEIVNI